MIEKRVHWKIAHRMMRLTRRGGFKNRYDALRNCYANHLYPHVELFHRAWVLRGLVIE